MTRESSAIILLTRESSAIILLTRESSAIILLMKKRISKKDRERERERERGRERKGHTFFGAFLDKREFRNYFVDEKKDKQER